MTNFGHIVGISKIYNILISQCYYSKLVSIAQATLYKISTVSVLTLNDFN